MTGKTQPKRLLILGASGKLGRKMCALGPQLAPYPVVLDKVFRTGMAGENRFVWAPGDDMGNLPPADCVLALWGVTPGSSEPLGKNATLAEAAVRVAEATGADRVIHCSSAAVYSAQMEACREDDPLAPPSEYGHAKVRMEAVISGLSTQVAQTVLRIGNIAGMESLFAAGAGSGHVTLDRFTSGGGPKRSYVGPSDLVRVFLALADLPRDRLPDVMNVGSHKPVAMSDLALAMGWRVSWTDERPNAREFATLDPARYQAVLPKLALTSDPVKIAADVKRLEPWA